MNSIISNDITVYDPTDELLNWCEKELVLPNPDYQKKIRMGFWVGKTPEKLRLYSRIGNAVRIPYGCLRTIWPLLREHPFDRDFPEPVDIDYGDTEVPLFDYQKTAVDRMVSLRYGILQAPAGSGKTQMGIALIQQFERRTLWLTHTADLLNQSRERAERYIPKELIGTITEGKVDIGTGVTFATIQTMATLNLSQYAKVWDVIIVDECHHAAGSPTRVSQYYKVLNALKARHKYGLSATVHRADGLIKATYALLGEVVYEVLDEEVESRVMKVGVKPIRTGTPLTADCLKPDGTLDFTAMVHYLTTDADRNARIIEDLKENRDHSCLILSDRVVHLNVLRSMLPAEMFLNSVLITGQMVGKAGKRQREAALEEMRSGKAKYLFATYALSKEGLDIPRLDRLFMTTPVKDEAVVIQALGRIARVFEGKGTPIAYDYVDGIRYCQRAFKQRLKHYKRIGAWLEP